MLHGGGIFTYIYQHFTPYINDPKVGRYSICGAPEHSIHPWIRGALWCGRSSSAPGFLFPAQAPDGLLRRLDPCFYFGFAKKNIDPNHGENDGEVDFNFFQEELYYYNMKTCLPYFRLIGRTNASDHPFLRGRASTDPEIGSSKCSSRDSSPNRENKLKSYKVMKMCFYLFGILEITTYETFDLSWCFCFKQFTRVTWPFWPIFAGFLRTKVVWIRGSDCTVTACNSKSLLDRVQGV